MRRWMLGAVIALGLLLAGCETGDEPGLVRFPTQVFTPRPIAAATYTPPAVTANTLTATVTPLPIPHITAQAPHMRVGQSVEGLDIVAWQFGNGSTRLVLIGGIHGGYEFNTVLLSQMLIEYFDQHPYDLLPGVSLTIIPMANPDGVMRGGGPEGRLNARGVDLNRNWDCDWSKQAVWGITPVDPGTAPLSEPESAALAQFLMAQPPDAVIWYHSAIGIIAQGECDGHSPGQDWLPGLLSDATGYPVHHFDYYEVTGDASNWLAKMGVPAVVTELASKDEPEFRRNLAGVIALECHFVLQRLPDAEHNPSVQRLCIQ
jgi:Zinc carboxypeptidase